MATYAEKKALRDQGLTYREIGKRLGISYQAAYSGLYVESEGDYFREATEKTCVFPKLRDWMNENRVGIRELCRRVWGYADSTTYTRTRRALNGTAEVTMEFINRTLKATGLTYEEIFLNV